MWGMPPGDAPSHPQEPSLTGPIQTQQRLTTWSFWAWIHNQWGCILSLPSPSPTCCLALKWPGPVGNSMLSHFLLLSVCSGPKWPSVDWLVSLHMHQPGPVDLTRPCDLECLPDCTRSFSPPPTPNLPSPSLLSLSHLPHPPLTSFRQKQCVDSWEQLGLPPNLDCFLSSAFCHPPFSSEGGK